MSKRLVIISILALGLTAQSCGGGSGPKGFWKSTDAGRTWEQRNLVLPKGKNRATPALNSVDIRFIAAAPDNDNILYIATPVGVFASDNGGEVWHHVLTELDAQTIEVARENPEIVYAIGNSAGRGVVYRSQDRGLSWERKYTEAAENFGWSLAVNPLDANEVLAGFSSGLLLRSRNGGETWSLVNDFTGRVQQLRFHPTDPRIYYVLLREVGLMLTRDGGNSFVSLTAPLTSTRNSLDILSFQGNSKATPRTFIGFDFTPGQPNVVYLTTNVGLFRTTDLGATWNGIRLPVDPSHAVTIAVDAFGIAGAIYVSIDTVLYRSADGGQTFNTARLPTNRLIRTIFVPVSSPETVYTGMIDN